MPRQGMGLDTWLGIGIGNVVGAHGIGKVIVPFAPTGQRIPAQGIALGNKSKRISVF